MTPVWLQYLVNSKRLQGLNMALPDPVPCIACGRRLPTVFPKFVGKQAHVEHDFQ